MERGDNCLSVGKIIDICSENKLSADYLLLGRVSNIDEETSKLLSKYKEKDVESIFAMIKLIMRLLSSKNNQS
ncbi:MAG: hypothetical protein FWF46_03425 [Oscillospiraceae bacterium]|nr:hypothetical protein [Oscillospiraceae bacterium]